MADLIVSGKDATITLRPRQIEHFNTIVKLLESQYAYIDSSIMGTGKTYVTVAVAIYFQLPIFVIGILPSKSVWESIVEKTGINMIKFITYEKLTGTSLHHNNQPYLFRQDIGKNAYFRRTDELLKIVQDGALFVVDEIQKIKNDVARHRAVREVVKTVITVPSQSRCALLSGIPVDQPSQIINLIRVLGLSINQKMYHITRLRQLSIKNTGLEEFITNSRKIDSKTTENVLNKYPMDVDNVDNIVLDLFLKVVKPHYMVSMDPIKFDYDIDIKNGYYIMEPEDEQNLIKGIKELDATSKELFAKKATIGFNKSITTSMMRIENSKLNIVTRNVKFELNTNPRVKIIVYVTYMNSIDTLETNLNDFNPLILKGKVPPDTRTKIINKFQLDPSRRLLLANIIVGGTALSLHDTVGDSPRYMYVIPNFGITDLHQATRRIIREGLKSDVKIRFVYGKGHVLETNILNNLARKTAFIGKILDKQVEANIEFPGDYSDDIETNERYNNMLKLI